MDRALEAGAHFIVAPGFNPGTVEYAQARGISVVPGVVTPSEIEAAMSLGLRVLKFFPAEAYGGVGIRCDDPAKLDDAIMDHLKMKRISPEEAYDKCLEKRKFRGFLAHPPEEDEN